MTLTDNNHSVFVIGVVGESPILALLHEIARSKTLQDRTVVIRNVPTTGDYQPCHILFVPASHVDEMASEFLTQARRTRTLIVGESPGFAQSAGMINFYVEDNKLKFEINQEAAKRAGLTVSSRLLALGRIVAADKPLSNR
jgi:hypothetical protein